MKEAWCNQGHFGDWKLHPVYGVGGQGVAMEPLMEIGDQS
jgi:hypothetical protein